jgi:predicted ATPase/transcriptional regulator with XRE-family HTH domain
MESASFGAWLKRRRQALGLTQAELARQVACAVITVQKLESGDRRPSHQVAERLVQVLEIAPEAHAYVLACARAGQAPEGIAAAPAIAGPALAPLPLPPVPLPLSPLRGRAAELRAVIAELRHAPTRLVTLVGPAGVGKTRLGLAVAHAIELDFAHGVAFFPLAHLHDPGQVMPALAQLLGVQAANQRLTNQLIATLRPRQMLLVLDNFEQVVDAAEALVDLLHGCPRLKALVTSRERLQVRGERLFAVPPLALPPAADAVVAAVAAAPAVELFVDVARGVQPDFALTDDNAAAIGAICARLNGLPLALELIAARAYLFEPRAMLARLDQQWALTVRSGRDAPTRHHTLRAALDWSYDLLSSDEQWVFAHMGAYVGGCTIAALAAIVRRDVATEDAADAPSFARAGDRDALLEHCTALVNKSLVQLVHGGEMRFELLETVRAYAVERLEQRGIWADVQRRHAQVYLALARQAEPALSGPEQQQWIEQVQREYPNVVAALRFLLDSGDVDGAAGLAVALRRFWWITGQPHEGRRWLEQVLAQSAVVPPHTQAQLLNALGMQLEGQGNLARAAEQFAASVALYRGVDDPPGLSTALYNLSTVLVDQGQYQAAAALLEEVVQLDRMQGDVTARDLAFELGTLGFLHYCLGDIEQAQPLLAESLELHRAAGDSNSIAVALSNLALVLRQQGDTATALRDIHEAIAIARTQAAHRSLVYALPVAGLLLLDECQFDDARRVLLEALALAEQVRDWRVITSILYACAALALARSHPASAAQFLGAAAAMRETSNTTQSAGEQAETRANLARARAQLSATAFDAAFAAGQRLDPETACRWAVAVLEQLV